jgi:hypothetical protein
MYMKNHNTRSHWLHVFASAGLKWLLGLGIPEEVLLDPVKLLKKVKYNLPVYDFIGWLFYCAMAGVEWKRAIRISDAKTLNFLWQYNIVLYGPTRKNTYKMGCLRHTKICKDSEPNVMAVINGYRTYSRSGNASKGEGWDDLNEQVRTPYPTHALCLAAVNLPGRRSMQGGRRG